MRPSLYPSAHFKLSCLLLGSLLAPAISGLYYHFKSCSDAYLRQKRAWTACLKDEVPSSYNTGALLFRPLCALLCKEPQGWRTQEKSSWNNARVQKRLWSRRPLVGTACKDTHCPEIEFGLIEVIKELMQRIWGNFYDKIKFSGSIHLERLLTLNKNGTTHNMKPNCYLVLLLCKLTVTYTQACTRKLTNESVQAHMHHLLIIKILI